MSKYIDADSLVFYIKHHQENVQCLDEELNEVYSLAHDHIIDIVEEMPAADVQEVKHGEWVQRGNNIYCTYCNKGFAIRYGVRLMSLNPYCPNCGAKMDGGE